MVWPRGSSFLPCGYPVVLALFVEKFFPIEFSILVEKSVNHYIRIYFLRLLSFSVFLSLFFHCRSPLLQQSPPPPAWPCRNRSLLPHPGALPESSFCVSSPTPPSTGAQETVWASPREGGSQHHLVPSTVQAVSCRVRREVGKWRDGVRLLLRIGKRLDTSAKGRISAKWLNVVVQLLSHVRLFAAP